jgi:hypothetical protein
MKTITHSWSDEKHNLFFSLVLKHLMLYSLFFIAGCLMYSYELIFSQSVLNAFSQGKSIVCKDDLVSKANHWSYDKKKRLFFNQLKVHSLQSCSFKE